MSRSQPLAVLLVTTPWQSKARLRTVEPVGKRAKRVVVAGGGIGGLCCAFELMELGHDVTVDSSR